ncbi:MAG: hypothetical protein M3336_06330, partial [Chloroflexota bacterium]|nr:hypothetical protein [Chloroflexota bacterium]
TGATVERAGAQMIGVPVLQNAFSNPGFTVAANVSGGSDATTYGVATAWAPTSGRFQVSAGLGLLDPDAGGGRATWGVRGAFPLPMPFDLSGFGVAVFGGLGGATDDGVTELRLPAGVGIGYRRALGTRRGISGYVTPFYSWTRVSGGGEARSNGLFRVSLAVDVAVLPVLGVTVGYETGPDADDGDPGPTGGLFGVGVSYALRRGP